MAKYLNRHFIIKTYEWKMRKGRDAQQHYLSGKCKFKRQWDSSTHTLTSTPWKEQKAPEVWEQHVKVGGALQATFMSMFQKVVVRSVHAQSDPTNQHLVNCGPKEKSISQPNFEWLADEAFLFLTFLKDRKKIHMYIKNSIHMWPRKPTIFIT